MPVVGRKSRKKYPGLYASICSQTRWCACSPLPSCQVRVARQGRKIRLRRLLLAADDLHKNLSHSACEFHSGPRSSRACQREDCNWRYIRVIIQPDERGLRERERGREYSPEKGQNPCLWAGLPRSALETDQTDAPTALPAPSRLPSLDVRPRALIHGVVDGHDDLHVWRPRIVVLTGHRRVELGFRRVYPVSFVVAARDGRELAGGGE
jgi:hypothetical protein